MHENYRIDNLDKSILSALMENARTPYAELGKRFAVSAGTIHVRVEKMKQAGIIEGTRVQVSAKRLGYDVCCFIGINLKSAKDYPPRWINCASWKRWWRPTTPPVITASSSK